MESGLTARMLAATQRYRLADVYRSLLASVAHQAMFWAIRSSMGSSQDRGDRWLDWLLQGRDAGHSEARKRSLAYLQPIYERVAAGGQIAAGDTVLEVGAGEGQMGLLALNAAGPTGRLVLTDHSASVVEHLANNLNPRLTDHVSILQSSAESLVGVPDASVDVVLIRSVLIYSSNPSAAFDAFVRVLRRGGRLSLFEPLWTFFSSVAVGDFFGRDLSAVPDEVSTVLKGYQTAPGSTAGLSVSASSFTAAAESAGFGPIRCVVEADSQPLGPGDEVAVEQALHGRPNPNAPSVADLASNLLPADRAQRFLAELATSVRTGRGRTRTASLYLTAAKP
jgi:arsenite methyltransferase